MTQNTLIHSPIYGYAKRTWFLRNLFSGCRSIQPLQSVAELSIVQNAHRDTLPVFSARGHFVPMLCSFLFPTAPKERRGEAL
jgi:hypothetical protein